MRVLLLDLDIRSRKRPFPNLALMKVSAWHKSKGDIVERNFPLFKSDITYGSCVFTWNSPAFLDPTIQYGGSGIDMKVELPVMIEHTMPDYNLYPMDFSLGFTSRGCLRKCQFCLDVKPKLKS